MTMRVGGQCGFTLVEMVLAMALTAVVGLAAAGVSAALSNGYAMSQGNYETLQAGRVTVGNLHRTIRSAKLVTMAGSEGLVVWAADPNGNDLINISELRVIELDQANARLFCHRVNLDGLDAGVRDALDAPVTLATAMAFQTIRSRVLSDVRCSTQSLADGVRSLTVSAIPACPQARTVSIEVLMSCQAVSQTLRSASTLRVDNTASVVRNAQTGLWYLAGEGS